MAISTLPEINMINDYTLYLADAIELCNTWEIPETDWADAVNSQARLIRADYEPLWQHSSQLH
jgi:hypothetical protein